MKGDIERKLKKGHSGGFCRAAKRPNDVVVPEKKRTNTDIDGCVVDLDDRALI